MKTDAIVLVVVAICIVIFSITVGYALGAKHHTVKLRGSCGVENIHHLKAGYYKEIEP